MNPILKAISDKGKKRRRKFKMENKPLPEDVLADEDVSYEIDESTTLMSDIFYPENNGNKKLPVIVTIHGGGFLMGNRKLNFTFRYMMAECGFLVYSLEHRLLDETDFFGALSDIGHGLKFVKETLEKYNGDPDRIYVVGESAGGLLALYATAMTGSDRIRDTIGVYCPDMKIKGLVLSSGMLYTTRVDYISAVYKGDLYGKRAKDKEFMKYMNPENPEVIDSLPKVCLASGYGDFLRKYTLRYANALEKAGHPSKLLYYDTGIKLPHAFMTLFPLLPESRDAIDKMLEFI